MCIRTQRGGTRSAIIGKRKIGMRSDYGGENYV